MTTEPVPTIPEFSIEDFLIEGMDFLRSKFDEIYPFHPGQRGLVWNRLIKEIEDERDGR